MEKSHGIVGSLAQLGVGQSNDDLIFERFLQNVTAHHFAQDSENIAQVANQLGALPLCVQLGLNQNDFSLQAEIVLIQAELHAQGESPKLIGDLGDILTVLREMMRCDVLEEPFKNEIIIGLTHAELRERSHDPMRFFHIQQMILPDYTMGRAYAMLNRLRTQVRETEVAANQAFREGKKCTRADIIEELNRMSSAVHIMMCMYLAGMYDKDRK